MNYFHNIELIDSKITGLIVDPLSDDPTFVTTDAGRIYFNIQSQILKLNNGQGYIDVSIPANFNNLIQTLGSNWISSNYGFVPDPFNNLQNVSGLTSNNSLFDVFVQLDTAIASINNTSLLNLSDVVETTVLSVGDILYYNGDNFTFTDLPTLIQNFGHLTFLGLSDVDPSNLVSGDVFFYNASSHSMKAASMVFTQEDLQTTLSHTIIHNLNVQYCSITIINRLTNTLINDAIVTFTGINQIDITLSLAAPIYVVLVATPNLDLV